jgi:hypothetical protein
VVKERLVQTCGVNSQESGVRKRNNEVDEWVEDQNPWIMTLAGLALAEVMRTLIRSLMVWTGSAKDTLHKLTGVSKRLLVVEVVIGCFVLDALFL